MAFYFTFATVLALIGSALVVGIGLVIAMPGRPRLGATSVYPGHPFVLAVTTGARGGMIWLRRDMTCTSFRFGSFKSWPDGFGLDVHLRIESGGRVVYEQRFQARRVGPDNHTLVEMQINNRRVDTLQIGPLSPHARFTLTGVVAAYKDTAVRELELFVTA